jgi:hypothetical protein
MTKIEGRLERVGKVPAFGCNMCDKSTKDKFRLWPHPAVIKLLDQWDQGHKDVCKACAIRELGSKKWKQYVEK